MRVRALDSHHDWTFGKGQNNYLRDRKAVEQTIGTRLESFLGDCFFSLGEGINWFGFLGSKNEIGLNLAVSAVITNTPGVYVLTQLSIALSPDTRRVRIQYGVQTVYGLVFAAVSVAATPDQFEIGTQDGDVIGTQDGNILGTQL